MRGTVANIAGLAACVAVGYGINTLLKLGSCGDVGMPACTGEHGVGIAWLIGGILVAAGSMVAGAQLAFAGLFAAIGIGAIVAGVQSADPDARLFGFIFGGCFLAGALVPLVLVARRTGRPAIGTVESVQDTGVTVNDNPRVKLGLLRPAGSADPAESLRKLYELHRAGALTEAEFTAAKARLLDL